MTRKKKLVLNSTSSLLYQLIALVCGFVLPRVFLATYGSTVNGLVSSVTQFLGFISFCEMGVGAVVQSTLYEPLAVGDTMSVSKVAISSERFFRKIAYILVAYTLVLMIGYPFMTAGDFDFVYTSLLILIMSISSFAQYYFGITYRLILTADQLGFIHYSVHSVTLILNTIGCIFFMNIGASIHLVKLASSTIFLLQPFVIAIVAKRRYKINRSIVLTEEPIKQKWNGLSQHVANVVLENTDVIVLTIMSTLENVSIYTIYHMVVHGVKQIIISLTRGMQAMLGNMLAKRETEILNQTFDFFEWIMHTGVTLAFSITSILIIPFISVYTSGVTDVNYIVPTFSYLITLAQAIHCLRVPYNVMVLAAGHYRQTQWSAIIEASINIIISVIAVLRFGLVGVAVGTLVAMLYRTCYLAWYLRNNIINRNFKNYLKHMLVDAISVIVFWCYISLVPNLYTLSKQTYLAWLWLAVKVGVTGILLTILVNFLFYRAFMVKIVRMILKRAKGFISKDK